MREIKFRAWHDEHKEMVNFDNKKASNDIYIARNILKLMADRSPFLMQYTGLKDKNGVEIYEGDIVNNGYENLEILWDEDRCCFDMRGRYDRSHIIRQLDCDIVLDLNIKVIGNIYEKPELLGGENV